MKPSKLSYFRSGSVAIGRKSHCSSVFSRTLSASKVCRGADLRSQIDATAQKPVDKRPSKRSNSPENQVGRVMSMQQRTGGELRLENVKAMVSRSTDDMEIEDKKMEVLESEFVKDRNFEFGFKVKDARVSKLEEELMNVETNEKENKEMIRYLEAELERLREAESKMVDSLGVRTKQLEATKMELEEAKIEITCLRRNIALLENGNSIGKEMANSTEEDIMNLNSEQKVKPKNVVDEVEPLKIELKLAIEAEEKSRNAMEDLALALKEVATEANEAKEKARIREIELEHVNGETEQLKAMLRRSEEQYQKLLDEAKQEAKLYKNTSDRLRLEAEEALLAWNGKEMCFVDCIKRAEEEKAITQHENNKLGDTLRTSREEIYKLRDILKQAVNEANAAKAASGIARDENSHLKNCLAEREEELHFLMKENERLRMNEAAARENVKEFKRLLSTGSSELKTERPRDDSVDKMNKCFSFNPEDFKFMNEPEDMNEHDLDENPEKTEALKGSIFDTNAETPRAEPHTPKSVTSNRRRHSSASGTLKTEDLDNFDSAQYDSDTDRNSHRRMRTMFRRVGDLLTVRRSFHRKEPSTE